jgi:type III pantothenate kinase
VEGHLAMIEGMVRRVADELGGARAVVLTGGFAETLADVPETFTDYVPTLTLDGLRLIFAKNRGSTSARSTSHSIER